MHQSSMDKMLSFRKRYLGGKENEPLVVLDLGSLDINGSYRRYFDFSPWTYLGVDMAPGKNVDVILENPYRWRQIRSGSVDVVISGQAFEHIELFWVAMLEITRVLRHGGLCCIIAPSGGREHRYPVDCWRFYPDGFSALARFAGLSLLEVSTQWEPDPKYTDDSNEWQDTTLVCEKTTLSRLGPWITKLRRFIFHKILTSGL
ncbi:MAG: methyltransferase domain-containing protein [Thermodesulfobacteriota bacterium]|nr:methyltransferase domain-containing protein [Thermodesulfobacteriota bacterium]